MNGDFGVERRALGGGGMTATAITTLDDRMIVLHEPMAGEPPASPSRIVALDDRLVDVAQETVGHRAVSIAADPGRGRLYVVNGGDAQQSVSLLDPVLLATIGRCPLGPGVVDIDVDRVAGLAYASNPAARAVHVLHADDLRVVDEVSDPTFVGLRGITVDAAMQRVFLARCSVPGEPPAGALSVIQRWATGDHTVARTIPLGAGTQPASVAVDAGAGLVYVVGCGPTAEAPAQLVVFDRQTLDELGRLVVGRRPTAIVARDGLAYVAVEDGIQVVDGRRRTIIGMAPVAGMSCLAADGRGRMIAAGAGGVARVEAVDSLAVSA